MSVPETDAEIHRRVEDLLHKGKNVYQPLYNYPFNQSIAALRPCADRCLAVEAAMQGAISGRRLFDIGCSLGFNTLYFADRGAIGHGIDIEPRNVALCREIQRYTPGQTAFWQAEIDLAFVAALMPGHYDYAFAFSVLHHVIEARGLDYVQDLMAALLSRVPVVFVELALREETPPPGYTWDAHLPDDPLAILSKAGPVTVDLVGHFATHVGPVDRPLYRIASA
jgi:SAM-dependent methyltransferase